MNLIKKTIKEALNTPGFSSLYIIGVAFTITFTMIYGMLLYGQLGPVYPEYDRSATAYIESTVIRNEYSTSTSRLSSEFIGEFLHDSIPSIEKVTSMIAWNSGFPMVQPDGNAPEFHVQTRDVEPSFFDFYQYEFKAGKPLTQEDLEPGVHTVVISDKVARRLFPTPEDAVGNDISINHNKYRIKGVFREGSPLCLDSYGEVFYPVTSGNDTRWPQKFTGLFRAIIKVKPGKENEFRAYIREVCQRINSVDSTAPKFHIPVVMSHAEHVLANPQIDYSPESTFQVKDESTAFELWKPFLIALLVILLIPALNISGLIGARMDRMRSEIGVRRCFGAKRPRLMSMVITENLILTLIGGFIGLIAAWLIVSLAGTFLLELTPLAYGNGSAFSESASFITGEMAFAPLLFALTLAICLILNVISAWIPARIAMHRQITESLNSKR